MTNRKKTTTSRKKPKRGFAILDRDQALKSAVGAINILRGLSKFETTAAPWRSGTGYALELVEGQLNYILRHSGDGRLPDDLFGKPQPVPADLGEARKAAAGAVKVLRKILKAARGDLSVGEHDCNELDSAIDRVEVALNDLLPPPGAPPRGTLPGFSGDDDGGAPESGSAGMKS
jgi:hypothetical protein